MEESRSGARVERGSQSRERGGRRQRKTAAGSKDGDKLDARLRKRCGDEAAKRQVVEGEKPKR